MSKITKKGVAWRLLVAAGLTALAAGTNTTAQAASTTKSLSTNFTVVNLSDQEATVAASYYKEGTAAGAGGESWTADAANTSFKLAGNGGQKIVRQYTDAVLTAGRGGVILSSDKPLGAIVQISVRTANTAASSGAYSAISTASDTFYVPLVARRGSSGSGTVNSQIIVQNANTTGAANVTVTFSGGFTKSLTIAPGASFYYDLDDEPGLNANYFGSAVVSAGAGGQIVVVSNLFSGPDGLQTFNAFPSTSVGTKWLVPLFVSRIPNGLNTPVAIQNLSGAEMAVGSVTMSCLGSSAASPAFSKTNTTAVANNGAYYFNPVTDQTLPTNWVGACTVTAPGNSVAFVQLRTVGGTGNPANAAAHEAINASGTNKRVFVPLVAKRLANGFATAVTIQNLGAGPATVNLTYKPSADYVAAGGSAADIVVGPYTIVPGGNLIQNHRTPGNGGTGNDVHNLPDTWFGTLVVTSNEPIDGFVQLTNYLAPAGDTFMAHNVFTQP